MSQYVDNINLPTQNKPVVASSYWPKMLQYVDNRAIYTGENKTRLILDAS